MHIHARIITLCMREHWAHHAEHGMFTDLMVVQNIRRASSLGIILAGALHVAPRCCVVCELLDFTVYLFEAAKQHSFA